ncbi:MAG: agmatinase [Candidatus Hodarchaeota archaeon]
MKFFDFGEVIDSNTEFVIFGIPWDYLSSNKAPNSAMAPNKIREITENLALTTEMGFKIPNLKVVDFGNINIISTNVNKNLKEIKNFVKKIYKQKKNVILVMIGGDHFCTFPVIKAIGNNFNNRSEFGVIIFDSHMDFYEQWDKNIYSHATISHRIYDLDYINNKNLIIVGTRDIDIPELTIANKENIVHLDAYMLIDDGLEKFIERIVDFFKQSNINYIYVSIDIDVLDPSIAPGTGYAIPGGLSYREMWQILKELAKQFNIVGFDLVELAPNLDLSNNMTCNLAAKLVIELISFIANNKKI